MFCMHTRTRWSDAAEVTAEPYLDVAEDRKGFIEAMADHSKTSGARGKRRRPIPLVGHAVGLSGLPWARARLEARRSYGMDAFLDGCLFRAVGADGTFLIRKRSSSEMGVWLRELFVRLGGYSLDDVQSIGSHSMKDTHLSWLAKAGVKHGTRRL